MLLLLLLLLLFAVIKFSGRGSPEKVGRWMHAEGRRVWGGYLPLPIMRIRGYDPRKFFENVGANLCNVVHFFRPRRSIRWHQVIRSGAENRRFSVPLLKVARNLPSRSYRFRVWYVSGCVSVVVLSYTGSYLKPVTNVRCCHSPSMVVKWHCVTSILSVGLQR